MVDSSDSRWMRSLAGPLFGILTNLGCGGATGPATASADSGVAANDANAATGDGGQGRSQAEASATEAGFSPDADSSHWSWQNCGAIPTTPSVTQAAFLPTGEVAISYEDGSVTLVTPGSPAQARTLVAPTGAQPPSTGTQDPFVLSLDGALLAKGSGPEITVWRTADGSPLHHLVLPTQCASGAPQFSAEADYLLETGGQATCIWRMADDTQIAEMQGSISPAAIQGGVLFAIEVTPGELVPGASPMTLVRYALPTGSCAAACPAPVQAAQIPLQAPAGWTSTSRDAVRISPRGDAVAAVSGAVLGATGGTAGKAIWRFDGSLAYLSFVPHFGLPFFSPSGDRVLLADQVVDVASASLDFLLSDQAALLAADTSSALDSTGKRLARWTDERDGRVELYDLPSGNAGQVLGALAPSSPFILPTDLSVSKDGTWLLTAEIQLAFLWRLDPDFGQSTILSANGVPGSSLLYDARFSTDGSEQVLSGDGYVALSTSTNDVLLGGLGNPSAFSCVTAARLSRLGDRLLLGGYDFDVHVLRTSDNTDIAQLPTGGCTARAVFNADETLVATSEPGLYRASDWSPLWRSAGPSTGGAARLEPLADVQFSPDQTELLVSQCLGDIRPPCAHARYSVADGSLLRNLPGLQGTRARFSPDGSWVVSGTTLLHLADDEQRVFDPLSILATFAPNGDIIALLADNSLARYCLTK